MPKRSHLFVGNSMWKQRTCANTSPYITVWSGHITILPPNLTKISSKFSEQLTGKIQQNFPAKKGRSKPVSTHKLTDCNWKLSVGKNLSQTAGIDHWSQKHAFNLSQLTHFAEFCRPTLDVNSTSAVQPSNSPCTLFWIPLLPFHSLATPDGLLQPVFPPTLSSLYHHSLPYTCWSRINMLIHLPAWGNIHF